MWYDKDMNENETFEFEGRSYLNPTTSRDEQLSFIDTLRETQSKNTAQINADTYALGSQLPSNLGGLRGGEDTFIARYQTPQTNETVANLRLAAQQSALNTALSNLQNAYKKRYNDAVQNYQKRSATPSTTPSTNDDDLTNLQGASQDPDAILGNPRTSSDVLDQPIAVVSDPVSGDSGTYYIDEKGNVIKTLKAPNQNPTTSSVKWKQPDFAAGLESFLSGINNLLMWNRTK